MIRSILFFLGLFLSVLPAKTQNEQSLQSENEYDQLFITTETMPYLLLKTEAPRDLQHYRQLTNQHLLKFIYSHFRYPPISRDRCISGTVVVSFTIGVDGMIDPASIRCVRDIGGGLGKEAIRVIRLMADLKWQWVPGKQMGVPVPVQYNMPMKICLE